MARKFFGLLALFAVLAAGFVSVRAISAQAHGGIMGMMSMMENCPMMGGVMAGPEAALRHEAELGLTAEQVTRLEDLQQTTPDASAMMDRMADVHEKMNAAAEGAEFDEAAVRDAFEEMNAMHTDMGIVMLRTTHEVRQILSPAQRELLDDLGREGMMGGMHGMMGGMMQDCPMMHGGMGSAAHGGSANPHHD